jgi:SAM-dependent methyltransferase
VIARSTREDPEAEAREIAAAPLRLGSIADFGEVPLKVLDAVAPRRVVEVGGAGGAFTRVLLEWARPRGAEVVCIDPDPAPSLAGLTAEGLELVREPSPAGLAAAGDFDLYVLDGDHNHAVLSAELALLPDGACALLHDVGWPLGRRDAYHDPARIEAPHPHSFTGHVLPGSAELQERGGLAGNPPLGLALHSGGEGNGVLTAAEDFLAANPGWELMIVPVLYGLGVLFGTAAAYVTELRRAVTPYVDSPLLARLEANRLALLYAQLREPLAE